MTDPVAPPGLPEAAEYLPCARDFGVRGDGSDESVAIRSAHDRVRETGGRFLWFPPGHYHAPSLVGAGDVIFVGEGRLTGAYRKSIVPPWAPAGGLVRSDIRPHRHLRRFARGLRSPSGAVVTIVGDSITTLADAVAPTEGVWECLKRKIRSDNPGRPIAFHHRGTSGGRWSTLAACPDPAFTQLPAWYDDGKRPWLSYVEATRPDLLIILLGMNDGSGLDVGARDRVVATVAGWAKPPDIVLCTCHAPSLQHPMYQAEGNMEGRDGAAGLIRSWAARAGYGLIDINRQAGLVREGFDPLRLVLERVVAGQPIVIGSAATPWVASELTHDFGLRLSLPQAQRLWDDGRRLAVQVGRNPGNLVALDRDASGGVGVEVSTVDGIACVPRFVSAANAPATGPMVIEVAVRGLALTVLVNGATAFEGPIERWGGRFRPSARVLGEGRPVDATLVSLAVSRPLPFMPQATDRELFGHEGGPLGGNGINHPSSRLVAAVYGPVIEAADFDTAAVPDSG